MKVKIINKSTHPLPAYQTEGASGMDLMAFLSESIVLHPGERKLIPTGIFMELPSGTEAQIRPRSGLAFKHGITVLNSPGTIDCDYRGEIKVLLINLGNEPFEIQSGERIAQMIIQPYLRAEWETTNALETSGRGVGGYGSTGK